HLSTLSLPDALPILPVRQARGEGQPPRGGMDGESLIGEMQLSARHDAQQGPEAQPPHPMHDLESKTLTCGRQGDTVTEGRPGARSEEHTSELQSPCN